MNSLTKLINENKNDIIKLILTQSEKGSEYTKAVIRPVKIKNKDYFQVERFKDKKVFHYNCAFENFTDFFIRELDGKFIQVLIDLAGKSYHCIKKNNGDYKIKETINNLIKSSAASHNREKEYILREGENIPALVELGVFTPEFKIVKSKYDKYKQINRFIEIIDEEFNKIDKNDIIILDFGCGKSYLTFILYYYFTVKKQMNTKIIGYDLKEDVVASCNEIAKKYKYDNLKFIVSDITKDTLYNEKIDMIVTLHACDTATDYALDYAIKKDVKYIFSVPCCQHEINKQIKSAGDMDILLRHGIIKERVSALLTDSIRAAVLEDMGYSVDLLEFIDFSHSPKNIMIRARKSHKKGQNNIKNALKLSEKYCFTQTLLELNKNNSCPD